MLILLLCVLWGGETDTLHADSLPPADHVVVIVMENKGLGEIYKNPSLPFFNATSGELLLNYWSVAHPSLPNYLALLGAHPPLPQTDNPKVRIPGDSLPEEMVRHGWTVAAYMQGLPYDGYGGGRYPRLFGRYVEKHDPFLLFSRLRKGPERQKVHPLSRLKEDLESNRLPAFSFVAPDLCHDMHGAFSCHMNRQELLGEGDRFLGKWIPLIERSRPFRQSRFWIFILWDESGSLPSWGGPPPPEVIPSRARMHGGGRVALLWIDSKRPEPSRVFCFANHYSLLETITENFRLPSLAPKGEGIPLPEKNGDCSKAPGATTLGHS
ncbi:MAG: alkaline phosphatase family protein [Leptospirillia bacterium]